MEQLSSETLTSSEQLYKFITDFLQTGKTEFPFALNRVEKIPENLQEFAQAQSLWSIPDMLRVSVYEAFMEAAHLPIPIRAFQVDSLHVLSIPTGEETGRTLFAIMQHETQGGKAYFLGASSKIEPKINEKKKN